jgi:hypothetical protein
MLREEENVLRETREKIVRKIRRKKRVFKLYIKRMIMEDEFLSRGGPVWIGLPHELR